MLHRRDRIRGRRDWERGDRGVWLGVWCIIFPREGRVLWLRGRNLMVISEEYGRAKEGVGRGTRRISRGVWMLLRIQRGGPDLFVSWLVYYNLVWLGGTNAQETGVNMVDLNLLVSKYLSNSYRDNTRTQPKWQKSQELATVGLHISNYSSSSSM